MKQVASAETNAITVMTGKLQARNPKAMLKETYCQLVRHFNQTLSDYPLPLYLSLLKYDWVKPKVVYGWITFG